MIPPIEPQLQLLQYWPILQFEVGQIIKVTIVVDISGTVQNK